MEHRGNDNLAFFVALQAKGWHLEDNCLYSPNGGTFRMGGAADVPRHMAESMYVRLKDVLEKMPQSQHLTPDKEQFRNWVEDMKSVVTTFKELLD